MVKNNIRTFAVLNKLHEQEAKFKRELAKTFLEYLDTLPNNKRIEQVESVLYETNNRSLPTLDRRLTPQESKCLLLASKGKEIKEMASILGLSQRTIKYHRANITKKLEVPNLMAAVALKKQDYATDDNEFSQTTSIQAYWNNIFTNIPGNVFVVDTEGYLRWGNQRILDTLNLKNLDEYTGKHIGYWDNYSWECCKAVIKSSQEIIGEESYQGRYYMTNRRPLFSSNDKMVAILGIALDITANKKAELAKQDFLMQMAHDLKNPLNLLGIQPQKTNKSNQQALLQSIHDTSQKLLELINSMVQ